MEGYFEIGKIAGTHGLKGTLRVFPTTDDPARFELLKEIIIECNKVKKTYTIKQVNYHKQFVLLSVKEIEDINQAELLKGGTIWIEEKDALPLGEDEYYARDLYDMEVFTEDGEYLGKIADIYVTGANDVYSVRDSQKPEQKELMIPAIKQCILKVDVRERKMTVHLLEGLREE